MKSKFILLTESPHLYSSKRILTEANRLSLETSYSNPYQCLLRLDKPLKVRKLENTLIFHRITGVRYDDFDLVIANHYNLSQASVLNSPESMQLFRSKDRQQLFFLENKIDCIPSLALRGPLDPRDIDIIKKLSPNQQYIIKMTRGNQGVGVNLVNGLNSLISLLETFYALRDQKFIIQPFIDHHDEYRIFFCDGEIFASVYKKLKKEDFRGNAKRVQAKMVTSLPNEIKGIIEKIILKSGLHYGGVDIISNKNKFYVTEVNAIPGFEQIESLSKLNVAKQILRSALTADKQRY